MVMPEAVAVDFFNQVISRDLDRRDFAHPFCWAAFYLTGVKKTTPLAHCRIVSGIDERPNESSALLRQPGNRASLC